METRRLTILALLLFLLLMVISGGQAWAWGVVGVGGGVTATDTTYCNASFTGIFCSDFEDATDRAQWDTTPTGWNAAYTSTVLDGSYSGFIAGNESANEVRAAIANISTSENTTIYARVRFKIQQYASTGTTSAMGFSLYNDATAVASCFLDCDDDASTCTVLNATDDDGSDSTNATDANFGTGTFFYIYIIYNDDTSMQCQVMDSTFTVINEGTAWSKTLSGNLGTVANKVEVWVYRPDQNTIWDNVEVRTDTSWGN